MDRGKEGGKSTLYHGESIGNSFSVAAPRAVGRAIKSFNAHSNGNPSQGYPNPSDKFGSYPKSSLLNKFDNSNYTHSSSKRRNLKFKDAATKMQNSCDEHKCMKDTQYHQMKKPGSTDIPPRSRLFKHSGGRGHARTATGNLLGSGPSAVWETETFGRATKTDLQARSKSLPPVEQLSKLGIHGQIKGSRIVSGCRKDHSLESLKTSYNGEIAPSIRSSNVVQENYLLAPPLQNCDETTPSLSQNAWDSTGKVADQSTYDLVSNDRVLEFTNRNDSPEDRMLGKSSIGHSSVWNDLPVPPVSGLVSTTNSVADLNSIISSPPGSPVSLDLGDYMNNEFVDCRAQDGEMTPQGKPVPLKKFREHALR